MAPPIRPDIAPISTSTSFPNVSLLATPKNKIIKTEENIPVTLPTIKNAFLDIMPDRKPENTYSEYDAIFTKSKELLIFSAVFK